MTRAQLLGSAMLATPFVAIFAGSAMLIGLLPTIGVFAISAFLVVWVVVGTHLTS